jgi:anti-sigma factor RsiW
MGAHLADIAVSDQHAVKPWFAGKLEFSPRVIDFAADGFPLAGGRLDYVAGRPAAAVVYTRRAHIINVLSYPDPSATDTPPQTTSDRGYQAISWAEPGVRLCAVSDLNADELMSLVRLVRKNEATSKQTAPTPRPPPSP